MGYHRFRFIKFQLKNRLHSVNVEMNRYESEPDFNIEDVVTWM